MRKPWPTLLALSVLSLAPLGLHAPLMAQTTGAAPAQARVIVKFKADSPLLQRRVQTASRSGAQASSLGQRVGLALAGGAMVNDRTQVVTAGGISSAELAKRLAAQGDVEYAEPDQWRRRMAVPNDPRYASGLGGNGPAVGQWYLRAPTGTVRSAINAEAAWDTSTGSSSVVVAVLDTGVRFDHEDLKRVSAGGNLLPGYDMIVDTATANDGDGRDTDPSDPGDAVLAGECGTGDPAQDESSSWHGTQTSGLIGALTNNGLGMASVGRTVHVLPVRVLGKCGGYNSDIVAGMLWAAGLAVPGAPTNATPAKVINMSLGGEGACSSLEADAVQQLTAAGVVVVASAGNSAGHAVSSPANCPGVIAVTGLRHVGSKVGFSDIGPEVAIAAPGGNCVNDTTLGLPCLYPILTTTNTGTTTPVVGGSAYSDSFNASVGTSFSAPLVAGTVGLMFSAQPTLTTTDVRAALQGSARIFPNSGSDTASVSACQAPTSSDQAECYCTSSTCGAGMLDSSAAVQAASIGLQALVTLSNEAPKKNQLLTLSASGSFVLSPRTITGYQWALADGGGIVTTIDSNGGAAATTTPSGDGRFVVSLTVTDSTGAQSTVLRAVDVAGSSTGGIGGVPVLPNPQLRTDGGDSGGGALGPAWLLGLAMGVVALWAQRNRRQRAEHIRVALRRQTPRG